MKDQKVSTERGQALVLIVLAMVVLLGFTALAVDGSMVYSDRRNAQNSADASSLAAGSTAAQRFEARNVTYSNWTASPPNCLGEVLGATNIGLSAGRQRATDNGFTIDTNISDGHGVVAECGVENITASLAGGGTTPIYIDKFADLKAMITDDTDTAFAHFVFGGLLRNTVTAVTRIRPRSPLAFGYAIVALNPAACQGNSNGAQFHGLGGNNNLHVDGGGIFSNGCMDVDGNPDVTVDNAGAYYFYTANNNDLDDIQTSFGEPQQLADNNANRIPFATYDIDPPDCSGHEVTSNWLVNYYDAHDSPGDDPTLPAGLYCVTDELRVNAHDRIEGYGVTIVLYNGANINGNATVRLQAAGPNSGTAAMPGLVIYQPATSQATIEWNGGSDTLLRGTVLAPRGTIIFLGDSVSEAIMSQFIGWNVEVGGSSVMNVIYDENNQVNRPASLELHR